jgi:Rrf2 family protein
MRMSAKAEYAVRAMTQLATAEPGVVVKTDDLAAAQGIPAQFLVDILADLRADRLVRSHRGRDGGYELARPAETISIADVLRCIDGPLASVRDIGLGDLPYSGPTAALTDVWRALRASMRALAMRRARMALAWRDCTVSWRASGGPLWRITAWRSIKF